MANPRYKPCQILHNQNIPYVIWFEDALHHYGVPTVVFDLYILVQDIDIAAECLVKAGWNMDTQDPPKIGNAEVESPQRRLFSADSETKTVLLPAEDWKFPLTDGTPFEIATEPQQVVMFPTLSGFLDALIDSWLDCDSNNSMLFGHLACQISYLHAHSPPLKERSFAEQLRYEHRQYHFDALAGMEKGTLPFWRHERAIREALLQGQYQLQECSASRDDKDLFFWGVPA